MPSPLVLSRYLLLFAIGICNIALIIILAHGFAAHTAGPFEVLATTAISIAVLIPFIVFLYRTKCRRTAESSSYTSNLVTFGALWLSESTSCIVLTFRARQNYATALCYDFYKSGGCIMANALLAVSYMSVIFAIVGFVIAYIDIHPGAARVSPRYPITKAPSSHFAALQHPLDPETGWTDIPLK
ncbi:hypothetical protein DEU56DRAFT_54045 [Suillus clintonianus]|uniref:uncharacterized protein n=1 Tax=Suillus clintonianus TaxID=1904413 RepID=UPI001B87AEA6|nr:uncharacterized protein DEU56DRAFT_54045 [Suillus clintonianus]KAG2149171.1 hypothetical protein DEU56DRAFT_54045 [Suillus clintonianus]